MAETTPLAVVVSFTCNVTVLPNRPSACETCCWVSIEAMFVDIVLVCCNEVNCAICAAICVSDCGFIGSCDVICVTSNFRKSPCDSVCDDSPDSMSVVEFAPGVELIEEMVDIKLGDG